MLPTDRGLLAVDESAYQSMSTKEQSTWDSVFAIKLRSSQQRAVADILRELKTQNSALHVAPPGTMMTL